MSCRSFRCQYPSLFCLLAGLLLLTSVSLANGHCPQGVYRDGHMYSADSSYIANSCATAGARCESVYFYSHGSFSEAQCIDGRWEHIESVKSLDADTVRCDYDDVPDNVEIVSTSIDVCGKSDYTCPAGYRAFSNVCGCGCVK